MAETAGGRSAGASSGGSIAAPLRVAVRVRPPRPGEASHIDCEQRIVAAKVIRRWVVDHQRKTAFVIEHDFVMAAALADKVVVYEGTPGKECTALSPVGLVQGFNSFLKQLDVTFRRDPSNHRPRVNKRGSLKDTEQKATGQLFTFDVDPEDEKEAAAANNKENRRGADGKNGKGGRAGK